MLRTIGALLLVGCGLGCCPTVPVGTLEAEYRELILPRVRASLEADETLTDEQRQAAIRHAETYLRLIRSLGN